MKRRGRERSEARRRRLRSARKKEERQQRKLEAEKAAAAALEEAMSRPPRPIVTVPTFTPCRKKSEAPKIKGSHCVKAWKNDAPNTPLMEKLGNVVTTWHGTHTEVIPKIATSRLKAGTRGLFGPGIYSTPDVYKAMVYARPDIFTDPGREHFCLLRCRVALGKSFEATRADGAVRKHLADNGFDSVIARRGLLDGAWGGYLRNSEVVVYQSDQIVVDRVFEYVRVAIEVEPPPPPPPPPPPVWKTDHPCLVRGRLCKYVMPGRDSGNCIVGRPVSSLRCPQY
jgi:hypothetical protein